MFILNLARSYKLINDFIMKRIRAFLLTLVAICMSASVFAHALWIETEGIGKAGVSHEVKVFYGEYAQNERDVTSKWYSDVKDLSLWIVGPDGQKAKLNTTLGDNVANASFTPEKDGQYTLMVSHEAKDLAGTTKYQFLTSATVHVGKPAATVNAEAISNELKIFPSAALSHQVNKAVKLKVMHKGVLKPEASINVFSPAGWSQVLISGADGETTFTPIWPGKYVVEVTDYQKAKGDHNGKPYEAVWQGSTYSFDVK